MTCIKPALWRHLSLCPYSRAKPTKITGIGGSVTTVLTLVNLFMATNFVIELCPIRAVDFPGDADILIGMDVIGMGDFAVCNTDNTTSFSFAVPPFSDRVNFIEKAEAANKHGAV